jgi:hypothetical protein
MPKVRLEKVGRINTRTAFVPDEWKAVDKWDRSNGLLLASSSRTSTIYLTDVSIINIIVSWTCHLMVGWKVARVCSAWRRSARADGPFGSTLQICIRNVALVSYQRFRSRWFVCAANTFKVGGDKDVVYRVDISTYLPYIHSWNFATNVNRYPRHLSGIWYPTTRIGHLPLILSDRLNSYHLIHSQDLSSGVILAREEI